MKDPMKPIPPVTRTCFGDILPDLQAFRGYPLRTDAGGYRHEHSRANRSRYWFATSLWSHLARTFSRARDAI